MCVEARSELTQLIPPAVSSVVLSVTNISFRWLRDSFDYRKPSVSAATERAPVALLPLPTGCHLIIIANLFRLLFLFYLT